MEIYHIYKLWYPGSRKVYINYTTRPLEEELDRHCRMFEFYANGWVKERDRRRTEPFSLYKQMLRVGFDRYRIQLINDVSEEDVESEIHRIEYDYEDYLIGIYTKAENGYYSSDTNRYHCKCCHSWIDFDDMRDHFESESHFVNETNNAHLPLMAAQEN